MGYYAAYLDLAGRRCVVVGGGPETEAKARGLVAAGASVSVVAKEPGAGLEALGGAVTLHRRGFRPGDLDGCFLAVDASGDDDLNQVVAAAARQRGVLLNVLDRPALCDFIAPALIQRGPLQVAISTAGRSPFMAAHVRRLLEATVTPALGQLVELAGELRDRLRAEGVPLAAQSEVYGRIPGCGALEALEAGDTNRARRLVQALAPNPPPSG
jgi:siroheme synthase-like protein